MSEFICPYCGKRMSHENETTLNIEKEYTLNFAQKRQSNLSTW
jgi:sarcosine oxidase delta subunit